MLNPLHTYYLQQMGIETWVLRTTTIQLMILGEPVNPGKPEQLLKNMLKSIDVGSQQMKFFSTTSIETLTQHLTRYSPQVFLAMGSASTDRDELRQYVDRFHNKPLLVIEHPNTLIHNLTNKKTAYQDLLRVQTLLNTIGA
jgi:hypothetical protein